MASTCTDFIDTVTMLLLFGIGLWTVSQIPPLTDGKSVDYFELPNFPEKLSIHQMYIGLSGALGVFQLAHVFHGMALRQKRTGLSSFLAVLLSLLIICIVALILVSDYGFYEIVTNRGRSASFDDFNKISLYIRMYFYFYFGLVNTLLIITFLVYLSSLSSFLISLCPKGKKIKSIDRLYDELKKATPTLEMLLKREEVRKLVENAAFTRKEFEILLNHHTEDYNPKVKNHQTFGVQVGLHKANDDRNTNGSYLVCELCVEQVKVGEDITSLPGCKHRYHKTCFLVHMMKNKACPKCKSPIRIGLLRWKYEHLFSRDLPNSSFIDVTEDDDNRDRTKSSIVKMDQDESIDVQSQRSDPNRSHRSKSDVPERKVEPKRPQSNSKYMGSELDPRFGGTSHINSDLPSSQFATMKFSQLD